MGELFLGEALSGWGHSHRKTYADSHNQNSDHGL